MAKSNQSSKTQAKQQLKRKIKRIVIGALAVCLFTTLGFAFVPVMHEAFWPSPELAKVADRFSGAAPGCILASRHYTGYSGAPDNSPTINISFKCNNTYDYVNNFIASEMKTVGCKYDVSIGYAGPPTTVEISGMCDQGYEGRFIGVGIDPANSNDPTLNNLSSTTNVPNVRVSGYEVDVD